MKTNPKAILASAVFFAVLSGSAFAESAFPVLRPENCDVDIKVPAGSNAQYYQSKDCKTVFILPRETSPLDVSDFQTSGHVNRQKCDMALAMMDKIPFVRDAITAFEAERVRLTRTMNSLLEQPGADIESITRNYTALIKTASDNITAERAYLAELMLGAPYSNLEGATATVHLTLNQQRDVTAYQQANEGSGLKFRAARIESGIISFGIMGQQEKVEGRSVLAAKFPQLGANSQNPLTASEFLIANGGLAGGLTYSHPVICKLVRDLSKNSFDESVLTKESFRTSGIAVNFLYDVPVTAEVTFDFTASTAANDLNVALNGSITKDEFSQSEISELIYSGTLAHNLVVKYGSGGVPDEIRGASIRDDEQLNSPDETNVYSLLFGQAMDLYLNAVLEKMKSTGAILETVNSEIDPIEGKELFREDVVRKCRWKTSWGRSRKKCHNYVTRNRYFQKGVSFANRTAADNSRVEINYTVSSEQILRMKHSSGFGRSVMGE